MKDYKNLKYRDYNDSDTFSLVLILERFDAVCQHRGVEHPEPLIPQKHVEGDVTWVYPVWFQVEQRIKQNDVACIDLGLWCLQVHEPIPFGRMIRDNVARAIGSAELLPDQCGTAKSIAMKLLFERFSMARCRSLTRMLLRSELPESELALFAADDNDPDWLARRKEHVRARHREWMVRRARGEDG